MQLFSVIVGLVKVVWHTFDDAAPYILFGVFVAGVIQIFVDKDRIAKHLGEPDFRSIFWSAIFGIPIPLCSCGVIPTAISLRKNGASKGAVLSFMISTPETGVDSIAISFALLDPILAIFRPISAFVTAIIAGIMENIFGKQEKITPQQGNVCIFCDEEGDEHNHSFIHKFKYGIHYGFVDLLGDIAKWLTIGIIIGGIISYFAPQSFIEKFLGSGWQAMFIMLLVGIPLYICASASTPIAAALIAKGMSPGVALVFLLAGPATNVAGILAVGKFLGKRSIAIYLLSISVCAILLGLLLNQIYAISGINIKTTLGSAADILPNYIKTISAIVLIILMLNAIRSVRKCK